MWRLQDSRSDPLASVSMSMVRQMLKSTGPLEKSHIILDSEKLSHSQRTTRG